MTKENVPPKREERGSTKIPRPKNQEPKIVEQVVVKPTKIKGN